MTKALLIILALIPFALAAQPDESVNYWENRQKKPNFKTAGSQLKAAGSAFFVSSIFSIAGTGILISANKSYEKSLLDDPTGDYTQQLNTQKTIAYITYGGSLISAFVAFGKLISAGNLMEEQRRIDQKNTSLNFTGNGLTFAYKF